MHFLYILGNLVGNHTKYFLVFTFTETSFTIISYFFSSGLQIMQIWPINYALLFWKCQDTQALLVLECL